MFDNILELGRDILINWLIYGDFLANFGVTPKSEFFFFLDRILLWFLRNFLVVGGLFYLFFKIFSKFNPASRIVKDDPQRNDLSREFKFAILGSLPSLFIGTIIFFIFPNSLEIYTDPDKYGRFYYLISFPLLVLGQDAYFYFTHRLLHTKWFFKKIHYVHHLSKNTNPLTGLSFHPWEAFILYFYPILVILFFPVHHLPLTFLTWYTIIFVTIGHGGWEVFPRFMRKRPWIFIFNNAFHHAQHHKEVNNNYSLYFNFWDFIFGSNHPDYEKELKSFNESQRD